MSTVIVKSYGDLAFGQKTRKSRALRVFTMHLVCLNLPNALLNGRLQLQVKTSATFWAKGIFSGVTCNISQVDVSEPLRLRVQGASSPRGQ
jgi:hypothetical protein